MSDEHSLLLTSRPQSVPAPVPERVQDDPLREVRSLKSWVRLGVYAAILGTEPIYIFLLNYSMEQVLVGLAIGLTIAFCAIEGAFSQMFRLRKRSAYPAVLLEELGTSAMVEEAAGHALESVARLLNVNAFIALPDSSRQLQVLAARGVTEEQAAQLIEVAGPELEATMSAADRTGHH